MLRVMGKAYAAWDMPGLTYHVRTNRMQQYATVLRHMLNTKLDSLHDMLSLGSRSVRLAGFTMEIYMMDLINIESRMWLTAMRPACATHLCERSLSTDDIETEFSILVNGIGYKATLAMVAGYLLNADFLAWVRRFGHLMGISAPNSRHSKYTHQVAMQRGNAAWNNGAAIRDLKIEIKYEEVIWARALNVLGLTRSPSVRR